MVRRRRFSLCFLIAAAVAALAGSKCFAQTPTWKFVEGDSWKYRIVEKEVIDQPFVPDAKFFHRNIEQTFDVGVHVDSVDAKGTAKVTVSVERVSISCSWQPAVSVQLSEKSYLGMGEFEFDSGSQKRPRVEVVAISEPIEKLIGATLELQISADGKISGYKRSRELTRAKVDESWDLVGGPSWTPDRLHKTLSSWVVPLPTNKEHVARKWTRVAPAYFWRESSGNETVALESPAAAAADKRFSFAAQYRPQDKSVSPPNVTRVGPSGKYDFDTDKGRLTSAERTLSVDRKFPTSKAELKLSNTIELR